jgi:transposase
VPLWDYTGCFTRDWKGISPGEWTRFTLYFKPRWPPSRRRKRGRPRIDDRRCFEAIIWLVATDGTWDRLPRHFPSERTIRRRVREWRKGGALARLWRSFLVSLMLDDRLKLERALGLTGTRRRAPWRHELDVKAANEALGRNTNENWFFRRRAWRFQPGPGPAAPPRPVNPGS